MKSFTIHGIDPVLDQKLQQRAQEWGLSQNKTVLRLLGESVSADLAAKEAAFRELFGAWSVDQKAEFDKASEPLSLVEEADWRR